MLRCACVVGLTKICKTQNITDIYTILFRFIKAKQYNVSGLYTDWDDLVVYNETGHDVTEEAEADMEVLDAAYDAMVSEVVLFPVATRK